MRFQPRKGVVFAFALIWLVVDVSSPYAKTFRWLTRNLYPISPSISDLGDHATARATAERMIFYNLLIVMWLTL